MASEFMSQKVQLSTLKRLTEPVAVSGSLKLMPISMMWAK